MARKNQSRSKSRKKGFSLFRNKKRSSRSRGNTSWKDKLLAPLKNFRLFDGEISLDRKLDITGALMIFVGGITLIGLLTTDRGQLLGKWVSILAQTVGWGVYLLPAALILFGFWLVLRNFEKLPNLSVERGVGGLLLFLFILTAMHFILFPDSQDTAFEIAQAGKGGGYLGGILNSMLNTWLGIGGTAITLIAWFLIGLTIFLDVPMASLFRWIRPLTTKIQEAWNDYQARQKAGVSATFQTTPAEKQPRTPEQATKSAVQNHTRAEATPETTDEEEVPRTWVLPPLEELLQKGDTSLIGDDFDKQRAELIEETLASFGAPARVVEINRGPTITQFGVEPLFIETRGRRVRVRIGKISALADDLALALAATRIRIQAPVPGKGFVGIEVPNDDVAIVTLRDSIESKAFRRLEGRPLRFSIGQDVSGNAVAADLAAMPHLLIAGTTGSGKSVCVNALIACLLMHNTPDDLRMIMVDPKRVELTGYDGIPHLLSPVVVDLKRVVGALQWVTREMDQRYQRFAESGTRNLEDYNKRMLDEGKRKLPYLLVVIDELADLMMLAPDETEKTITRLAQMARATGIHMVISTQRPSVDIVTGLIKANFPARIAFAVASSVDSRVILDQPGAERLLGSGDMLFQAPDAAAPIRLQGVFVSDQELQRIVQFWRNQAGYASPTSAFSSPSGIPDAIPGKVPLKQMPLWEDMQEEEKKDPLLDEAIDLVRRRGRASISMLQRRLRIGYTRAARLIETMEEKGIVSEPLAGSQHREILDYGEAAPPADGG